MENWYLKDSFIKLKIQNIENENKTKKRPKNPTTKAH